MHKTARRALLFLTPVLALAGGFWFGWVANTFLAQDACLDRGGVWNGDLRACNLGDQ